MQLEFWFVRPQSNLLTITLASLALKPERNGELLKMAIWTSYLKQVFFDVAFHKPG